jgi:hypothetical protein
LDDRTKAAIKAKFKSVKDKLGDEASQQIDALPTAWERAVLAHDLSLGQLGKFVKTDLAKYDLPETSEEMMYFTRSYRSTDKGSTTKIPFGENISYYEHKPRFQTRIRSWLKDNYDRKTIVLLTPKQMDELDIDRDIVKDLDDLPKIERYSSGSVGSSVKTFTFDRGYSHWKDREYWDENTTEVDGSEMVYIQIHRFQPTGNSSGRIYGLSSNSEIQRILAKLEKVGIKVPTVHGLKSAYLNTKKFKTGNYVALNDYIEREVSKIAPESKQQYDEEQFELMKGLSKLIEQEDLDMWLELQEDEPPESLLHLVKMCRLEIGEDTLLQELQDDFFKRYPMVAFIDRWELERNRNDELAEKIAKINHYIEGKVRDEHDDK